MKPGRRTVRLCVVGVMTVVGLTACRDNGLPDRNLPLEEARHRTYSYPVYEATPGDRPVAAAGRNWMPSLPVEKIPDAVLVPVGNGGDTPLYAVRGEAEPYDRLYAQVGAGEWRPYLRLQ